MKNILALSLLIFACGCATISWQKSPAVEYVDKARKFSAVLPAGWMYLTGMPNFQATRDGLALNEIEVERIKFKEDLQGVKKQFKPGMLPDEIAQVMIDIYTARADVRKFELKSNESTEVGGKDACRITFRYQTQDGLWTRGTRYGFIYDNVVYSILLEAADQYYYDQVRGAFASFIKSFKLLSN